MFMWLVADHVHPSSTGGHTALHNGDIRCNTENGRKGNKPDL
jgi:5-methylcytosine-specific restriction endonuclease McrA